MKKRFRVAATFWLAAVASVSVADCKHGLPIEGMVSLATCDPGKTNCLNANEAITVFFKKFEEADQANASVLSNVFHASPWHAYDSDYRILRVEELAALTRELLQKEKQVRRVDLHASWSGVRPSPGTLSIAEQLSKALKGFPVAGSQGFLWINAKGEMRTTRQAFTGRQGYNYRVAKDGEVMISAALSELTVAFDQIRASKNPEGLLRAGAAWEIFGLCPENALAAYKEAAALGSTIAAFNAAVIHVERGTPADLAKASELLSRAAAQGDGRSRELLSKLRESSAPAIIATNGDGDDGRGSTKQKSTARSRANEDARDCLLLNDAARIRACAEKLR